MLIKVVYFTETSILHHLLLVSQHAVMTSGNDTRFLKSFVFSEARRGKLICTCIFPCLVCANQHATARPHSRHCQAEQAIIWVALPPPPPPKPWTHSPPRVCLSHFDLQPRYEKHADTHTTLANTLLNVSHTYIHYTYWFKLHKEAIGRHFSSTWGEIYPETQCF